MYNVINRRVHVYMLADNAQACVCDSATGPVPAGSAKALCETLQKHVTIEAGDHWTETDPETLLAEFADFHARAKSGAPCTYIYSIFTYAAGKAQTVSTLVDGAHSMCNAVVAKCRPSEHTRMRVFICHQHACRLRPIWRRARLTQQKAFLWRTRTIVQQCPTVYHGPEESRSATRCRTERILYIYPLNVYICIYTQIYVYMQI